MHNLTPTVVAIGSTVKSEGPSHDDIRQMLCNLIRKKYGKGEDDYDTHIDDVFDDSCVYCKKKEYFKQDYELRNGIVPVLKGTPQKVVRFTEWRPAK